MFEHAAGHDPGGVQVDGLESLDAPVEQSEDQRLEQAVGVAWMVEHVAVQDDALGFGEGDFRRPRLGRRLPDFRRRLRRLAGDRQVGLGGRGREAVGGPNMGSGRSLVGCDP